MSPLSNLYLFYPFTFSFFLFFFSTTRDGYCYGKYPISVNFCFSNYKAERSVPDTGASLR